MNPNASEELLDKYSINFLTSRNWVEQTLLDNPLQRNSYGWAARAGLRLGWLEKNHGYFCVLDHEKYTLKFLHGGLNTDGKEQGNILITLSR